METLISQFQAHLEEELKLHLSLKELVTEETRVIIRRDVCRLEEIIEEKGKLLSAIACLEKNRIKFREEISLKLGLGLLTLREICLKIPPESGHKLDSLRLELKTALNSIIRAGKINSAMLDHYLKYSSFFIKKVINISQGSGNTYSSSGYLNTAGNGKSLLIYQKV